MERWQVIYYESPNGENPVSDFLDTLDRQAQSKLLRIFHNIEEYGLQSVIPHIKKLSGTPFWEIRVLGENNIRVIYVLPGNLQVLLLHGFIKKSQRTPPKELEVAFKRYRESILRDKSR